MLFRLDRFATLYIAKPLRRAVSRRTVSLPILMYHSISDDPEMGVYPYYRTGTSPKVFAEQMKYLHDNGYRTLSLQEAVRKLEARNAEPAREVVITFDDGYRDFYSDAFPLLQRFGFSATVFLPTAFIGNHEIRFKGKTCLTWAEVRELRNHGIVFGSHTVNHPQLCVLDPRTVKHELAISKQTIEQNLGVVTNSFAYPFAFPEAQNSFLEMLRTVLVSCGYVCGVSTCIGTARPDGQPYFLRRLPINSLDDSCLFAAKLHGDYDWLHGIQYASKCLRRAV